LKWGEEDGANGLDGRGAVGFEGIRGVVQPMDKEKADEGIGQTIQEQPSSSRAGMTMERS